MSSTFICNHCGEQVPVRMRHGWPKKIRCPACGAVGNKPDLSIESDDAVNSDPYRMTADPNQTVPCIKCTQSLPLGAIVCHHCGFNRQTGTSLERVHERLDEQWETAFSFPVRFGVFLVFETAVLVTALAGVVSEGRLTGVLPMAVFATVLGAFVLGTYPAVRLWRGKKGKVRLRKIWRIGFLPLSRDEIRWQEFRRVDVIVAESSGFMEWITMIWLFPLGLIPAFLWWWYVIRADQFDVLLCKDSDLPTILYRGRNQTMARAIADAIRGVTGLE